MFNYITLSSYIKLSLKEENITDKLHNVPKCTVFSLVYSTSNKKVVVKGEYILWIIKLPPSHIL